MQPDAYTGRSHLAARAAKGVTTIELDPGVQAIAQLNPWSQELFANPKITQVMGDAYEVAPTFADESFDHIMHDPPTFKLAGELYSGAFYRELYCILKRGGRLIHYIGDPNSKANSGVTRGVVRRLQEAGFSRIYGARRRMGWWRINSESAPHLPSETPADSHGILPGNASLQHTAWYTSRQQAR